MAEKVYRLSHSRRVMRWAQSLYQKQGNTLSSEKLRYLETLLASLDGALLQNNREEANKQAKKTEEFIEANIQTSLWDNFFDKARSFFLEAIVAIVLALVIATLVRQMWFELYEIPTGSMRPTFREQDHLTVSKTQFGLNIPLKPEHFFFDPALVQRTSVLTFTAENLPMRDVDTTCFFILPCKKRLIKRLMAKPGDTLYFYGGKIYALDRDGNPIEELLNSPWMKNLEHIPFMTFEGEVDLKSPSQYIVQHMHLPIGKISFNSQGQAEGEVYTGTQWVKDQPQAQLKNHEHIQTLSDFWGIRNFAMARLLTKEELKDFADIDPKEIGDGILYLELRHTPSLTYPKPQRSRLPINHGLVLNAFRTYIPLQQKHLDALMDHMYTARFVIKNGLARRYSAEGRGYFGDGSPRFPGVPDGTYEFYFGKASKVAWAGMTFDVPLESPLYGRDPRNIQKLFNIGIDMNNEYEPRSRDQVLFPNRYAYFREGDLYLLGSPIIKKGDPILTAFLDREQKKEKQGTSTRPYVAFKDYGPPLKDGQYDKEFIRAFGLKMPEKQYLVLGDNHAMSADSRIFGFVPESNLQGVPSLILWPAGNRWGIPDQKPYPIFVAPRLFVWGIAALIGIIYWIWHRQNLRKPIFKKIDAAKRI